MIFIANLIMNNFCVHIQSVLARNLGLSCFGIMSHYNHYILIEHENALICHMHKQTHTHTQTRRLAIAAEELPENYLACILFVEFVYDVLAPAMAACYMAAQKRALFRLCQLKYILRQIPSHPKCVDPVHRSPSLGGRRCKLVCKLRSPASNGIIHYWKFKFGAKSSH